MSRRLVLASVLALALPIAALEAPETGEVAHTLAEVRADLEEARLDRAIAALDVLAARTDLSEGERVETLSLRAQAKEATGALGAVEEDYRRILALHPGFEPDPASTGKRARERFERARAALVGTLEAAVDPADAAILVDGRALVPGADGRARVLAGSRAVRVERKGFDPAELALDVPPGGSGYGKMTEVNAYLVSKSMNSVVMNQEKRFGIIDKYKELLKINYSTQVVPRETNDSVFAILLESQEIRDKIFDVLAKNNIESKIYYQPVVEETDYFRRTLPNTFDIYSRILSLPVYPKMENEVEQICKVINEAL